MGKLILNNLINGIALALLAAFMVGAFNVYVEFKLSRQQSIDNQKKIYKKISEVKKEVSDKNYEINKRIDIIHNNSQKANYQIDSLGVCIRQLTYSVTKNNIEMKQTLKEIKENNVFQYSNNDNGWENQYYVHKKLK